PGRAASRPRPPGVVSEVAPATPSCRRRSASPARATPSVRRGSRRKPASARRPSRSAPRALRATRQAQELRFVECRYAESSSVIRLAAGRVATHDVRRLLGHGRRDAPAEALDQLARRLARKRTERSRDDEALPRERLRTLRLDAGLSHLHAFGGE